MQRGASEAYLGREHVVETRQLGPEGAHPRRLRDDEQPVGNLLESNQEADLAPAVVAPEQALLILDRVCLEQLLRVVSCWHDRSERRQGWGRVRRGERFRSQCRREGGEGVNRKVELREGIRRRLLAEQTWRQGERRARRCWKADAGIWRGRARVVVRDEERRPLGQCWRGKARLRRRHRSVGRSACR